MSDSDIDLSKIDHDGFSEASSKESDSVDATVESPRIIASSPSTPEIVEHYATRLPQRFVGRYLIERQLGSGGFGVVLLAKDSVLNRYVALKISKQQEAASQQLQAALIAEARSAANIDHPNLVKIFDVDQCSNQTFIIMEYVQGKSLAGIIQENDLLPLKRVRSLLIQTARALEVLHSSGIVHRDLKPANILVTASDHVKVVDLGLALSDETPIDNQKQFAGTRQYMSPEQVLGELHRIDGRTDIWALGVILYELLTRQSPFRSRNSSAIFSQILKGELPSPRQRRPDIPDRLEKICLKCLSRRMGQRYQSARQLIDELEALDLDSYATQPTSGKTNAIEGMVLETTPQPVGSTKEENSRPASSEAKTSEITQLRKLVPRGLRAFTHSDSSYFLKLMPGPHDIDGHPVILNFWLDWITKPKSSSGVGVIYGPSGCGKSSFVKAALLPHLTDELTTFYFDFTSQNPHQDFLSELQSKFSIAKPATTLSQAFSLIRRKQYPDRIVLVLDHFERALISQRIDLEHELVRVLRQCDGTHLQAIVLVRDEFWSEISRFMQLLDSSLSDGENAMSYPSMLTGQATKVLEAFGRAHEMLPPYGTDLSPSQSDFCKSAIDGLAQGGTVLPVRIALLTELMRGQPWEEKIISEFGGLDSALVRFLADSFESTSAPMSRRSVAIPCKQILGLLLPLEQSDLKASAKTYTDLLELSGYREQPWEFQQAIRCLEQDLKLISPLRGEGDQCEFVLVHDYLVAPIRAWLTESDNATWIGRQRLLIRTKADRYKHDPNSENLLKPTTWLTAKLFLPKRSFSKEQQTVINRSAPRALAVFSIASFALASAITMGSMLYNHSQRLDTQTRNAVYFGVFSFLNAKNDLEESLRIAKENTTLAESVIRDVRVSGEPELQPRATLLSARLGLPLSGQEIADALSGSQPVEWNQWSVYLSDEKHRTDLLSYLADLDPIDVSPTAHWQYLINGDFRLLETWKDSRTSEVASQRLLAFLVSQAGFDYKERGLKPEEQQQLAQRVAVFYRNQSKDLPCVVRLAILLYGFEEPVASEGFDWLSFAREHAADSDRSVALPAQWLLGKLTGQLFVATPAQEPATWKACEPVTGAPFCMIRVEDGELEFQSPADLNTKERRIIVVVDKPFWLSQTEVPEQLLEKFFESNPELRGDWSPSEIPNKPATGLAPIAWIKFCNWLSELENLNPCYAFSETDRFSGTNVEGVWFNGDADGYRLPTASEMQWTVSQGDMPFFLKYSELYPYSMHVSPRPERALQKPCYTILPDAWSFQGLMGNSFEIVMNSQNEVCVSIMRISAERQDSITLWSTSVPAQTPDHTINSTIGMRLARNAEN